MPARWVLPGASIRVIRACKRVLSASRTPGVYRRMSTEGFWMPLVECYRASRMIMGASMGF